MLPSKSIIAWTIHILNFLSLFAEIGAFLNQAVPFSLRPISQAVQMNQDAQHKARAGVYPAFAGSARLVKKALFSTETPASDDKDDAFDIYENEDFMDGLRLRIAKSQVFGPGMEDKPKPKDVFIILFEKDTDNEGVHSIEFPKGSGNNVVLAFESEEQCESFANTLKNQHFYDPQPTEIPLQDLEEFCADASVEVQVVPKGISLNPPSENVDMFDHDPHFHQTKSKLESLLDLTYEPEGEDTFGSWE